MITAIANQKGGVAKTTSTIALGGLLAEEGSCLVIDLDPQGNLTTGLGIELQEGQPTLYEVLGGQANIKDAIIDTSFNISVLPSNITLSRAERELSTQDEKFSALREKLKPLRRHYEHILIDCPPSMGMLTGNALCAANAVLIPVQCQFFAMKGLEGLLHSITQVKKKLNPRLKILGVLPTMAETNTLMTQDVLRTLKNQFSDITIYNPVPKSVKFPESNLAGEPIHLYSGEWKLVQPYRDVARDMMIMQEDQSPQRAT
jgi:chromosome partitioning protein